MKWLISGTIIFVHTISRIDFIPDLMTLACTSSFCFRNLCTFLSSLCDFVSLTRFYGTLKLPRSHTQHTRKNAAVQNWNISKKIAFVHLFKSFCCKIKKTLRFAILTSLDWLHTHWKFQVWVAHSWFADSYSNSRTRMHWQIDTRFAVTSNINRMYFLSIWVHRFWPQWQQKSKQTNKRGENNKRSFITLTQRSLEIGRFHLWRFENPSINFYMTLFCQVVYCVQLLFIYHVAVNTAHLIHFYRLA